jgi:hypothetical protein
MIISPFCVALTTEEVLRLMSYMFDKNPLIEWSNSVPAPFCSENPPPEVGIFIFLDLIFF